jgi:hypothetical protein
MDKVKKKTAFTDYEITALTGIEPRLSISLTICVLTEVSYYGINCHAVERNVCRNDNGRSLIILIQFVFFVFFLLVRFDDSHHLDGIKVFV